MQTVTIEQFQAMDAAAKCAFWRNLPISRRDTYRDIGGLTSQLKQYEGDRVEVLDAPGDTPRRFWVGRSTGWRPCHLEIHNARSMGGDAARAAYFSIRLVKRGPR